MRESNKEVRNDMEIKISVRSLVEFILRSGDIDNRRAVSGENAMQEGGRIHRMIQRRMGPEYRAEVSLRHVYDAGEYEIVVEGRADGIITDGEVHQNVIAVFQGIGNTLHHRTNHICFGVHTGKSEKYAAAIRV